MDDIFDHDDLLSRQPQGGSPFRSREEIEVENERLREGLLRLREENKLLAELLTGQFDGDSGEVSEASAGADPGPARQQFVISDGAIDLFEALPEAFTLDEVLDRAEGLGQVAAAAARHLRAYLGEQMAVQEGEHFIKTGRKPYF